MSCMENERIIDQGGEQRCPICLRKFDWNYKLDLMPWNGGCTAVQDKPSGHVSFLAVGDNKVQFNIACPLCKCIYQTEPMSRKNAEYGN